MNLEFHYRTETVDVYDRWQQKLASAILHRALMDAVENFDSSICNPGQKKRTRDSARAYLLRPDEIVCQAAGFQVDTVVKVSREIIQEHDRKHKKAPKSRKKKFCKVCQEFKPLDDFYRISKGRRPECKTCYRIKYPR